MLTTKRRAETPLSTWIAIGAILIIVLAIAGVISLPKGAIGGPSQTVGLVNVIKPIQFTCFDALTGSNCGAVTVKVFRGTSTGSAESLTASASGVATTGNAYLSGTALTIGVSGNSKVTEYLPFTVPQMDPNSAISATNNIVAVYAVTLGGWIQSLTGTNGMTTFVSATQYGLSSWTGSTITITDAVSETTSNAGYKSSYDITNLLNQYLVIRVDDGAGASSSSQYLGLTGLANNVKTGNTNYYFEVCPDGLVSGFGFSQVASGNYISVGTQSAGTSSGCTGSASLQTVGTTTAGGAMSFSFTVTQGSLASGQIETLSFKVFYYTDPAYFSANGGNMGPNNAQAGSTFTIKINP